MPWLAQENPRLFFSQRTLAVQHRGHWIALPTIVQQYSKLSLVQHCGGSNASDLSVQSIKSKSTH